MVLWLSYLTLRSAVREEATLASSGEAGPGFFGAAAVNVTNPNAWIFWSAVGGPIVATAWRADPSSAMGFLLAFYGCITAGNCVLVLLSAGIARTGPRVARALGMASGLALLVFGLWQLFRVLWP